jgi:hypothetical protein
MFSIKLKMVNTIKAVVKSINVKGTNNRADKGKYLKFHG